MKLYTDKSQTAKLIELRFEKPKSSVECELPKGDWRIGAVGIRKAYSIGELLSFLPKEIDYNGFKNSLYIFVNQGVWVVEYSDFLGELYSTYKSELIDAIFDVCVKLKEEELI